MSRLDQLTDQLQKKYGYIIRLVDVARAIGTTRGAILTALSAGRKTYSALALAQHANRYWYSTPGHVAAYIVSLENKCAAPALDPATSKQRTSVITLTPAQKKRLVDSL